MKLTAIVIVGVALGWALPSHAVDPLSIFQTPGCTVEDHLGFTVEPSDISLGAIYGGTLNALTNGARPGTPQQSFGRLNGCVSTEPERDQMQYSGIQKSFALLWVLRDVPNCAGTRAFEGHISSVINHAMVSTQYDSVAGNASWFVKTGGRFYGTPYPSLNWARDCLKRNAIACAAAPSLTQGALDLLGMHVEDGRCVLGIAFPFVYPLEPRDTRKSNLGPGIAGQGVTFPAPTGEDLEALHDVEAAHHEVAMYWLRYADWYDAGQEGPAPVQPVSRIGETMARYIQLSAKFVDDNNLVNVPDARGRRHTRDDLVLKLQHYRQLLPFGGTDPTQTPRETANWQLLAHRDHRIWAVTQEAGAHVNQWEETRDADKQHFNDHACMSLKGSTAMLPRFRCQNALDGLAPFASCPTMTCDQYLASQIASGEIARLTEEARAEEGAI